MIRKLLGGEGGQEAGRLANKGLETMKSMAERAVEAGKEGLERLEEVVTGAVKDGRVTSDPAIRKPGAVPVIEILEEATIREVSAEQLQKRLAGRFQTAKQLSPRAAETEAGLALEAANKQLNTAISGAVASLLGFEHVKGTTLPVAEVLQHVRVGYADGLVSGGKARFLTPQGQVLPAAVLHQRYATQHALYEAILKGEVVPHVLVDASAVGATDMTGRLTTQLLTHELTHLLFPAPYVGDALREGMTELLAVTLTRKALPGALAGGYELEVAAAEALVQLNRAAFPGEKGSTETILGHLLTSRRAESILATRLKLDYAEEQLLHDALQSGDAKLVLRNLLKLNERLVKQKKSQPIELDAILRDLIDPSQAPLVKRKLAGR